MAGAFAGMREMFEPPVFFEALGVRYTGPVRRPRHRRLEQALRHAAELDGPIVVHVLTQKGRGYPPAENDDDQAPARQRRVRPRHRPATSAAASPRTRRRSPRRSSRRPRTGPSWSPSPRPCPAPPACSRSRTASPSRLIDVGIAEQHAVTVGRRHGHGRAAPRRRHLLDVPHPGLRPGQPRRRPARPARRLLPRPRRHHRRRRRLAPRRARHGAADEGPGHDGVRPVVVPGAAGDAPRRARHHDGPVAIRWPKTAAPTVGEDEVGHGLSGRKVRDGDDICLVGVGKMLGRGRGGRRRAGGRRHVRARSGTRGS